MNCSHLLLCVLLSPSLALGVAQNYAANEQRKVRQQRGKAPLVDSTLLRFLSSEKKSGTVLLDKEDIGQSGNNAVTVDAPNRSSRAVEVDLPTFVAENTEGGELESPASPSAVPADLARESPIEGQSWLSQYNAQRVALKLQALGVDNEASLKAGRIV